MVINLNPSQQTAGVAGKSEDLLAMLEDDKTVFLELAKLRPYYDAVVKEALRMAETGKRDAAFKYLEITGFRRYQAVWANYQSRQNDIRNSLAGKVQEWSADVVQKAKDIWNKYASGWGLSAVQLSVPVIIGAVAVVALAAAAILVDRHRNRVTLDRKELVDITNSLCQRDPKNCKKYMKTLMKEGFESEEGPVSDVTEGLQTALIIGAAGVVAFALANNRQVKEAFKQLTKKSKRR